MGDSTCVTVPSDQPSPQAVACNSSAATAPVPRKLAERRSAPASHEYSLGQQVEVYSSSGGQWISAEILQVSSDGAVTVRYADKTRMKHIPVSECDLLLRHSAAQLTTAPRRFKLS